MTIHLSDRVFELLTPEVVAGVSDGAAESTETTRRAADAIVPALLAATARFAESPAGAERLLGLLRDGGYDRFDRRELVGQISSPHARTQIKLEGARLLDRVLGSRRLEVTEQLGRETGLSAPTAGRLMSLLMPIVMGALGTVVSERALDAASLSRLLAAEEPRLARGLSGEVDSLVRGGPAAEPAPAGEPKRGPRSGARSWLFAGALAILALVVLPQIFPGTDNPFRQDMGPGPDAAGDLDSTRTWGEQGAARDAEGREPRAREAEGEDLVKGKPAGEALEPTEIDDASVEDVARYLESDARGVRRFLLRGLRYESGEVAIPDEAGATVDRLAERVARHPDVVVLVTGRADAAGESDENRALATERARAVAERLVRGGVESRRVRVLSAGDTEASRRGAAPAERVVEITLVKSDERADEPAPRY